MKSQDPKEHNFLTFSELFTRNDVFPVFWLRSWLTSWGGSRLECLKRPSGRGAWDLALLPPPPLSLGLPSPPWRWVAFPPWDTSMTTSVFRFGWLLRRNINIKIFNLFTLVEEEDERTKKTSYKSFKLGDFLN